MSEDGMPQPIKFSTTMVPFPRVDTDKALSWRIRIHGLVEHECTISLHNPQDRFEVVTMPVTVIYAGNRRKQQNVLRKSLGFSWGSSGPDDAPLERSDVQQLPVLPSVPPPPLLPTAPFSTAVILPSSDSGAPLSHRHMTSTFSMLEAQSPVPIETRQSCQRTAGLNRAGGESGGAGVGAEGSMEHQHSHQPLQRLRSRTAPGVWRALQQAHIAPPQDRHAQALFSPSRTLQSSRCNCTVNGVAAALALAPAAAALVLAPLNGPVSLDPTSIEMCHSHERTITSAHVPPSEYVLEGEDPRKMAGAHQCFHLFDFNVPIPILHTH
ncbi:hypothetical protein B0H21DRAFT_848668 [Amylocystis lapponica]|nr:hypothetical protein B0H21DRAFT_848668 [Amylocystis lapponica]